MREQLQIKSFQDLMQHGDCVICCLYTGQQVRTLTIKGDNCHILAGDGTELDVPLETKIRYEPWAMDRGNMLFNYQGGELKICGEADVLITEDETEYQVSP
jgi:hypothetical protein